MKSRWQQTMLLVKRHKIITGIIIICIAGGGYYAYASNTAGKVTVSYVTQPATEGTLVSSITGSGQVSPEDQLDLKSQVSEDVTYVGVKNGQQVKAGQLLVAFNTKDQQEAINNAQIALDNANLSTQKMQQSDSTEPLTLQQAQDNVTQSYANAFNTISSVFLNLPTVVSGLNEVLYGNDLSKTYQNVNYYEDYTSTYSKDATTYHDQTVAAFQKANTDYNNNFTDYKALTRTSDTTTVSAVLSETYTTSQEISDAVKDMNNLIEFYDQTFADQNLPPNPAAQTQLNTLSTYTGEVNTDLSNLLTAQSSIQSAQNAIANDQVSAQADTLNEQSQTYSVEQAQNSLNDAKANLANCYIYAPFAGIVASVPVNLHDSVSSGTTAVTLITNQSITEIPFNEIDITKIKVGQKATLTFDAIDGLSLVGQVTNIDTLGTVTQGVVNYNVEIAFDATGTQVKPGMSVTASIITAADQNVLTVPNSAVKTSGGQSYVQVLVNGKPQQKPVQIGTANDTDTEITSGLNAGDEVVTQTITTGGTKAATASSSAVRIPGLTTGGTGGFAGGTSGGFAGGARTTTGR